MVSDACPYGFVQNSILSNCLGLIFLFFFNHFITDQILAMAFNIHNIYEDPKKLHYSWRTCTPFRLLQYLLYAIATIGQDGMLQENEDISELLSSQQTSCIYSWEDIRKALRESLQPTDRVIFRTTTSRLDRYLGEVYAFHLLDDQLEALDRHADQELTLLQPEPLNNNSTLVNRSIKFHPNLFIGQDIIPTFFLKPGRVAQGSLMMKFVGRFCFKSINQKLFDNSVPIRKIFEIKDIYKDMEDYFIGNRMTFANLFLDEGKAKAAIKNNGHASYLQRNQYGYGWDLFKSIKFQGVAGETPILQYAYNKLSRAKKLTFRTVVFYPAHHSEQEFEDYLKGWSMCYKTRLQGRQLSRTEIEKFSIEEPVFPFAIPALDGLLSESYEDCLQYLAQHHLPSQKFLKAVTQLKIHIHYHLNQYIEAMADPRSSQNPNTLEENFYGQCETWVPGISLDQKFRASIDKKLEGLS